MSPVKQYGKQSKEPKLQKINQGLQQKRISE